ncbi:MAG: glycerol-3-phosphate 1-O-acyltransferase PlsY [Anaeromyxobacteraceae bacterium]
MAHDRLAWTLVGASYLLGSIPFGLLLGRAYAGIDVRQSGSGNIGATNVARTAGKKLGVLTLLLDAAKGAIPVAVTAVALRTSNDATWPAMSGLAAFLGHVFPFWLRFRGGKGVATAFGAFLVLSSWLAAAAAGAFAATFLLSRTVSLASMAAAFTTAAVALAIEGTSWPVTRVAVVVLLVVLVRHQSNVRRMLRGEEGRLAARRSARRSSRPPGG